MAYYDEFGKKRDIHLEGMRYLNKGSFGAIYHNQDIVLKKYLQTFEPKALTLEMFRFLRSIKNPHLIELYEIYSEMNFLHFLAYKTDFYPFKTQAYTAKYYADNSVNVLYEHVDYLLDNLWEIEKLVSIFTKERVVAKDLKRDNLILGKEAMVMIDPDLFYQTNSSEDTVTYLNKQELLRAIRSVFIANLSTHLHGKEYSRKVYEELVNFNVEDTQEVTYQIYQKLKSVKRPVDYFTK